MDNDSNCAPPGWSRHLARRGLSRAGRAQFYHWGSLLRWWYFTVLKYIWSSLVKRPSSTNCQNGSNFFLLKTAAYILSWPVDIFTTWLFRRTDSSITFLSAKIVLVNSSYTCSIAWLRWSEAAKRQCQVQSALTHSTHSLLHEQDSSQPCDPSATITFAMCKGSLSSWKLKGRRHGSRIG